jgi:hypothetical protein
MKWTWTCDLQNVLLKVSASSFAITCLPWDPFAFGTFSSIFEYSSKALNIGKVAMTLEDEIVFAYNGICSLLPGRIKPTWINISHQIV